MNFKNLVKSILPVFILEYYRSHRIYVEEFSFHGPLSIKSDIEKKYKLQGDLLEIFVNNRDGMVHKWHHYIPLYERYFSPYREEKLRFLEIGVSEGGSLEMWRKYFGPKAIIFGIDINPECAKFDGQAGKVRIGSQGDKDFLERVVSEMGGVDIILDDGSHHMKYIPTTLEILFPHLSNGGIYMIEDLHTAFWKEFGGGYGNRKNFFNYIFDVINDMHSWYHKKGIRKMGIGDDCSGVHIHDSIVVLEKGNVFPPVHSKVQG